MASRPDARPAAAREPAPAPAPAPPSAPSRLGTLLTWEATLRAQASVPELLYFLANETRALVAHDQLFVIRRASVGDGFVVACASSVAAVDRNAPAIRMIEAAARGFNAACDFAAPDDEAIADYPFRHWRWQPLVDRDGTLFAGLLLARQDRFDAAEADRLARMAETAQHGWLALTGNKPVRRLPRFTRRQRRGIAAALTALALCPVQTSALAPVEVVAARPHVVTAPFAGVIASIDVAPNARVAAGQTVLRFDDVKLRNDVAIAGQRLQIARAKVDQVSSASFGDAKEARGISIAQAELNLATAEYGYARDLLARARVVAPTAGLAIYTDRREWEGRAVDVGQPILQIADPAAVRYRIDLPAHDQLDLSRGSAVSVWLDSQPLWSLSATLRDASYQARATPGGTLAFALDAVPAAGAPPRIGSRGTARVHGRWAPLVYTLLKRPISAFRQTIGF